jgi:hypothetical protein
MSRLNVDNIGFILVIIITTTCHWHGPGTVVNCLGGAGKLEIVAAEANLVLPEVLIAATKRLVIGRRAPAWQWS